MAQVAQGLDDFGRFFGARGLAWLALATPALAGASEPKTAFRVEYTTHASCGSAEAFSAQLLRHSERVRLASEAENALTFKVDIDSSDAAVAGRLTVVEPDGTETLRDVPGANCEEVFAAMALIAAVLVDPNVSALPRTPPAPEPPRPPPKIRVAARPQPPEPSPWAFGAGVGLAIEGAVAPEPMAGISVAADAAFERGRVLSPRFALALQHTFTDRTETPSGVARFNWTAVRLSGCPVRWPPSGALAVRPCALFDVGVLNAAGERTERADSAAMVWAAPGGAAYLELKPVSALKITLEGGLVAPLIRDHFYFDPKSADTVAFEVPPLGGIGRLGVSTLFP